jgi:RNA polymerase sigma-70 factor (ECF subfamily)
MRNGDGNELKNVLAEDVGFWGDGGGRVIAAKRPVLGRDAVVNLLLGIRRTAAANGAPPDKIRVDVIEVNYDPAMLVRVDGRVDSVYVCSVEDDSIVAIRVVRNPEKLVYLARQLSASQ